MAEEVKTVFTVEGKGFDQAFNGMEGLLDALNKIGKTCESINTKMDGLGKSTAKAMKEGEKEADSFITKLGKIGLAIDGVKGIAQSIVGAVQPIFEEGLARENATNVFGKMLGTPEQGAEYAKKLRESSLAALYGSVTINNAAQQMLAFGISGDDTYKVLDSIGNIAIGDANKLNSLALAFAQMSSLGKLQTQDWKQMIGQGFNPLNEIAKKTGETMEQLQERMSKGAISADEVKEAFLSASGAGGDFAGIMEDQMNGVGGGLKSIQSAVADFKAALYDFLKPLAQDILPTITSLMRGLVALVGSPVFAMFAKLVGIIGVGLLAYNGYMKAATMWTTILAAKQWLLNVAMTANPIGLIVAGISALILMIVELVKHYDECGEAMTVCLGPLGLLISGVMKFVELWGYIVDGFQNNGIIEGIKRIGQTILSAIISPLAAMFEQLGLDSIASGLRSLIVGGASGTARGVADIAAKVSGKTGTSTSEGKGMGVPATATTDTTTKGKATKSNVKAATSSIATGGTRNTSISISLQSLVHSITYNGTSSEVGNSISSDIETQLLRVLSSAESSL